MMATAFQGSNKPPLSPEMVQAMQTKLQEQQHHEEEEEVDDDAELEKEWDEGGPSHCGYGEGVHDTLMSVGESVHNVVGDPSPELEDGIMKQVGNWFQEMSYAVRDIVRGNKDVEDDISKTASNIKDDAMVAVFGSQEGN